jgi:hypothetical protein
MAFLRRLSFAAVGAAFLTGCFTFDSGSGCDFQGTNGLADNGNFSWVCSGTGDPFCDSRDTLVSTSLPSTVARGSRFGLGFRGQRGGVVPVSSAAVRTTKGELVALTTGPIGFIVPAEPEAVDAIRLFVAESDGLAIARSSDPPLLGTRRWTRMTTGQRDRIAMGEPITLRASGLLRLNELAGTLEDIVWSIDPPEIASLAPNGVGTWELTPLSPGRGRLFATRGAVAGEARFEIMEAPDAGVDFDAGVVDASDDAADANDGGDS